MKVTYSWLKDFIDIPISAQALSTKLTMAGLEVTSLEKKDGDFVLELEITSNRPDLLSVVGIAREISAILGGRLKLPKVNYRQKNKNLNEGFYINVENKKDCPLYIARIIKGINVKPSPEWLKKRLELIGLRSVNNIVDISNYVLIETGQPLHAFDLERLEGDAIFVRRGEESESITTIDGKKRNLNNQILVIADKKHPIAIAGIMGAKDSEVSSRTKNILLEAAVFDPITTRRAARILGLSSDSSYRFERGIDLQGVDFASSRAAGLILELAGGELILIKVTAKPKEKKKTIILKTEELNWLLGKDYPLKQIEKILISLSFQLRKKKAGEFKVDVPSFRIDINQAVDLIEEIARISGYDKIPSRLPRVLPQIEVPSVWRQSKMVRDILLGQGINEVVTYSLISKVLTDQFGYSDNELISIANPLSAQQEFLRPSLIPGLVSCVGYNLNQKQKDIRIFEIGNIFKNNQEQSFLGLAYAGQEPNLILHIIAVLELLFDRVGIEGEKVVSKHPCFHKTESLSLIVNKKICANLGVIKPNILESMDIKGFVFAAELDLELIFAEINKISKKYTPLPLYPEVTRDISMVLKQDISFGDIIKKIKFSKIPYLVKINLKDSYSGEQIPSGFQGLTLSCIYRASDHTLTTQEIDSTHQKVLNILKTEFSAQQR